MMCECKLGTWESCEHSVNDQNNTMPEELPEKLLWELTGISV